MMKRRLRLSIMLALLAAPSTTLAQMGVEDDYGQTEETWTEQEPFTGEGIRVRDGSGPSSLDEASTSGSSITLGRGGRTRGGSLAPRSIPPSYTVRRGDTLWDITGHFYGNPYEWPRVWSYNPEITNPHWIYPQANLRLVPEGQRAARLPGGREVPVVETPAAAARRTPGAIRLEEEGYLDRDALQASGIIVGSPEDHMMLAPYDDVYVQFEENANVRPGQEYTVFRRMGEDERGETEEGELVRIFGTVRVRSYDRDQHLARATIVNALDPIERGYRVAGMVRRFEMVPPVRNERDVVARVVASLRPRQLVGDQQVIFVNAGSEQGVRKGNRFFIVEHGDAWREGLSAPPREVGATSDEGGEPEEYPPEIIAEARVVNVRPRSAALMVTRAVREVEMGDRAEMRRGY